MKILFLVTEFPSVSETFVLDQVIGLIEAGHQVVVCAEFRGRSNITHLDYQNFRLEQYACWSDIPKNKLCRILKASLIITQLLPRHPVTVLQSLNFIKYKDFAFTLRLLFLSNLFRKHRELLSKNDIIHCHFGPNGTKALHLKTLGLLRGKISTVFHGTDVSAYLYGKQRNPYSYLFRHGDCFLPVSRHWAKKLIRLGCDRKKMIVHHMGVNCDSTLAREKSKADLKSGLKVLSIARLVEKKGLVYGIRAVAQLIHAGRSIDYEIIGDGPLADMLQTEIYRQRCESSVHLLGWQDRTIVQKHIASADVLIAPSVTSSSGDQEGIPVALMEAMAVGVPVVSTWHSGIPELVEDGKSGILVPERDVCALAKAIDQLLQDKDRLECLGAAAQLVVKKDFNVKRLNEQLVQIFQKVATE